MSVMKRAELPLVVGCKTRLHLGCGPVDFGKGWVQIDQEEWPHVDVVMDVGDLQSDGSADFVNTVDTIYASHVLEYFDWTEVLDVLRSWSRALVPGGKLMVAVPDFAAIASLYWGKSVPLSMLLGHLYGRMDVGFPIYHKMAYDYKTLHQVLRMADFHRVNVLNPYEWATEVGVSELDDGSLAYNHGMLASLNVLAYKRK